jgi:hypothetical protein
VGGAALFQGELGFGAQQVELQPDLAVVFQFVLLIRGELAFLISGRQLLHAVEVLLIEGEIEKNLAASGVMSP